MLFVNISLMGPPLTHFLGHFGLLTPFTVLAGLAMFILSPVGGDYLSAPRDHLLTARLPLRALLP